MVRMHHHGAPVGDLVGLIVTTGESLALLVKKDGQWLKPGGAAGGRVPNLAVYCGG